jgi:phage terminase large subunit
MRDRSPELLIEGPADTGKSMACLNKLLLANLNYAKNRTAMVRKTRRSLTQSTMVTWEQKVCPPGIAAWSATDQEYRFANGSVCVAGGLDDPGKLLSTEFDLVYVNEADQLTSEDWQSLRSRCTGRWGVMPYQQLLGDLNPTYPSHHLYQREAAGTLRVLLARHEDNPTVTPARLAALDSLTGWLRDRLRLGVRSAPDGMFFTEWHPSHHIVEPFPIPAHWPRWTSTDYGFAEPFCNFSYARDPSTRTIYLFREVYAPGLRAPVQAALIAKRIREERLELAVPDGKRLYSAHVGDPSMFNKRTEVGLPSIAEEYQRAGVALEPATNNRRQGWEVVRNALAWNVDKPPRLRVFRGRAPNLERTLPAMVHDPLDPEDLAHKLHSKETEDHAVDCLRYGLVFEASPPRPTATRVTHGRG